MVLIFCDWLFCSQGDETVPLLFKTLSKDCRDDIWSFIDYHVDCYQASEKDSVSARARHVIATKPYMW